MAAPAATAGATVSGGFKAVHFLGRGLDPFVLRKQAAAADHGRGTRSAAAQPGRPRGNAPAPPEAAADAPKGEKERALEEVSALLAASETRTTKFLAVRLAELGEALSGLAKAVEASAEQAAPKPPKDDGRRRPIPRSGAVRSRRISTGGGNCNGTTTGGCFWRPARPRRCCRPGFSCRRRRESCRGAILRTDGRTMSGKSTERKWWTAN